MRSYSRGFWTLLYPSHLWIQGGRHEIPNSCFQHQLLAGPLISCGVHRFEAASLVLSDGYNGHTGELGGLVAMIRASTVREPVDAIAGDLRLLSGRFFAHSSMGLPCMMRE